MYHFCRDKTRACRDKHVFVETKHDFRRDKSMLKIFCRDKRRVLSRQKINDTCLPPMIELCPCMDCKL